MRGDEPYERKNYVAMPRVKIICEGREKQKQEGNTISERSMNEKFSRTSKAKR